MIQRHATLQTIGLLVLVLVVVQLVVFPFLSGLLYTLGLLITASIGIVVIVLSVVLIHTELR